MSDETNIIRLAELVGKKEVVTEDAVALAFASQYAGTFLYDHDIKAWFHWTGNHWEQERTRLAFDWARDLVRSLTESETIKIKAIGRKTSFVNGVEKFATTDRAFAVKANMWNSDPFLLATPSGTIDLHTGALRPGNPDDRIKQITAVEPFDFADCPQWIAFLEQVARGDDELIGFLKRWCGYCLTGDVREHALAFLFGPGGNGKSVFQKIIHAILGSYATTAAMETFIFSTYERHSTDLAMLHGARLVTASETEDGRAWAETRIKQVTGGDPVSARFMRCDHFTYDPTFKLMIIGNYEPALKHVDEAAKRRFNMVPFLHKPAKPDKELFEKLWAEAPGILRWMIDGCLECRETASTRPRPSKGRRRATSITRTSSSNGSTRNASRSQATTPGSAHPPSCSSPGPPTSKPPATFPEPAKPSPEPSNAADSYNADNMAASAPGRGYNSSPRQITTTTAKTTTTG